MKIQFLIRRTIYLIVSFALIASVLGSCKKGDDEKEEDDNNAYMISFKANNILQEFTKDDLLIGNIGIDGSGDYYVGSAEGTSSAVRVLLNVFDKKAITENTTYSDYVITPATSQTPVYPFGAYIGYHKVNEQKYYDSGRQNSNATITITSITTKSMRGKFKGTVKLMDQADISITEGKFFVPRSSQ